MGFNPSVSYTLTDRGHEFLDTYWNEGKVESEKTERLQSVMSPQVKTYYKAMLWTLISIREERFSSAHIHTYLVKQGGRLADIHMGMLHDLEERGYIQEVTPLPSAFEEFRMYE